MDQVARRAAPASSIPVALALSAVEVGSPLPAQGLFNLTRILLSLPCPLAGRRCKRAPPPIFVWTLQTGDASWWPPGPRLDFPGEDAYAALVAADFTARGITPVKLHLMDWDFGSHLTTAWQE